PTPIRRPREPIYSPLSRQRRRICFVQYQGGGGGRDPFLLGFSPTQMERKNSLTRSEDFRQPKNRFADVLPHAGVGRGVYSAFVRRDGHHLDSRTAPDDRLVGQWQVCHLLFLFGNSEGERPRAARR